MSNEEKRFAVLRTGEVKFESDSFIECYNFCENGKHDGVWDRKDNDWAMTVNVEFGD